MRIEHLGLYVDNLERMRDFYTRYFDAASGPRYENTAKKFTSCFLRFEGGARLELMHQGERVSPGERVLGYAHLAVAVGSRQAVLALTERLRQDGYAVIGEPRTTGDGYFESVVLDPEGNRVEITV